jgi:hypothetical protein
LSSLAGLRQILSALSRVQGDKTLILISGGWPLDEREETSMMATVAADAAAARVTLHTLFVARSTFSAERRALSSTPARDQYLHYGPLETLASMTGGSSYRTEVNAEGAFDRLSRELSGYYRIGVEKDPSDTLDAKQRKLKVQVNRSGLTVRARDIFDTRTYEDRDWAARLSSALESPVPATSVGVRLTSYIAADPDKADNVKLVLTGEASRMQVGEAMFQLLVKDEAGKRIFMGEQQLGEPVNGIASFATNVPIQPGKYIVRVAIQDGTGRVGSVDHRVDARLNSLGPLSVSSPLLVRVPIGAIGEPRLALDGVQQDERLALEVDLEGEAANVKGAEVAFEIAADATSPALLHSTATLAPGSRDGSVIAQGVTDMRILPPGDYVARAKVTSDTKTIGEVRRAFSVVGPRLTADVNGSNASIVGRVAPPPLVVRAAGTVPPFALEQVLAPQVLNPYLDRVAARPDATEPAIRQLIDRAHAGGVGNLTVSDDLAADAPVAAFLRGLSLLSQNKLDAAANSFRTAMRASSDFYPAMVYLGACYAAGGNDKEASGAWRTALIKEGDALPLHVLLTDALLRQGNGEIALQTVDRARARWPEDEGLKKRYVTASLVAGKYAEGLQVLDELVQKKTEDEPTLVIALLVLYDAFQHDRPVQTVEQDRARMLRLADAYRAHNGPSMALIDTWVAAASGKK